MDWMIRGLNPDRDKIFTSSQKHPDWICGPPSLLSNGYCGLFLWGYSNHPPCAIKAQVYIAIAFLHRDIPEDLIVVFLVEYSTGQTE
jgi:hypothetical protein